MELALVLQNACDAKVQAEVRPLAERAAALRSCLSTFETAFREDAQQRVLTAMLSAVNQEAPEPLKALEEERPKLRTALLDLLELIGGSPPVLRVVPEAEPSSAKTPPPPTLAGQTVQALADAAFAPFEDDPTPSREEKILTSSAQRLIEEIEDLATSDLKPRPPIQIATHIQALTAEVRLLLPKLPGTHHLFWQLEKSIPMLTKIRAESCPHNYVRGLAKDHVDDWEKIARDSREKMAGFEGGEDESLAPPAPPAPIEWPALRRRLQNKPLVIAGGIEKPEKLRTIKDRFNIQAEWLAINNGGPRSTASIVQRIKTGGISAIIILEGLIGHPTSRKLMDACLSSNVPYTLGYRGGIGDVEKSLGELDREIQGSPV